ncbi:hypothetical protein VTN02DRAFT_5464 [Thermoascus thermophilus]
MMNHTSPVARVPYILGETNSLYITRALRASPTPSAPPSGVSTSTPAEHPPHAHAPGHRLPEPLSVQRLLANGRHAITGITRDGWSYNYELDGGKPVRLDNVTVGETVWLHWSKAKMTE